MNSDLEDAIVNALRAKAEAVPPTPVPPLGAATTVRPVPARRGWLVPAAAALVAVVAVGAAVFVFATGGETPAPVAGSEARQGDLAPGEVYYSLRLSSVGDGDAVLEYELWQPKDRAGEWRQKVAGGPTIEDGRVVPGDGAVATRPGGVCYPAFTETEKSCTTPPSWRNPTVEFLATAPRDPATIRAQLHSIAVAELGNGADDLVNLFELRMIGVVLTGNGVPPELSSALRQVTAAIPGVTVTANMADLLGERGTGYSLDLPTGGALTVIFDADDRYLGSPTEAVRHGVAPGLGLPPSRMLGF